MRLKAGDFEGLTFRIRKNVATAAEQIRTRGEYFSSLLEPMAEVYSFKGNNSLSRDKLNYDAGSVKNIHYGDIHTKFSTHFVITQELVPFINEAEECVIRDENLCTEGDMIFADASEDMADIGKAIEITHLNGERVVSGLHTILARRMGERIALGFGGHLFKSGWVRTQIQKEAQGTKVLGISPKRLRNVQLPLPNDSAEQQKIADCLSAVDELIAAQARKVDALKTHKKGLMQQLFPREGETQPRLRFPEFRDAGAWQKFPLSSFVLSLDAGVSVNSGDSRPANKTEFGVLKTSAITKGQFEPEENKVVLAESELSRLREPVSGDTIIICRKNTPALVGANAYVESNHENLFLPDLLWAAKPRERAYMRFLAFILGSEKGRAALSKLAKGSSASMSNISKADVLAFPVMAPAAAEQQRIVDCLTALDTLITSATQALETLKAHKKGLMQQLFPSAEAVEA